MRRAACALHLLAWFAGLAMVASAARSPQPKAAQHDWKRYTNVRFQYAICYPEDLLVPQGESENGDGERCAATDGAHLITYGQNNALATSLKDTLAEVTSRLAGRSGTVTSKVLKANWFIVSGRNGRRVFYAKTFSSHDQYKSFELTYDLSATATYEPLIRRLTACFVDLAP
jgi:hypothetical protein